MTSIHSTTHDSMDRYFTEFLAGKRHELLLPKLQNLSAIFHIELLDTPNSIWTLAIKKGMLDSISNGASTAQCGFKLKRETFATIIGGKMSPQTAFFKREVEIDGNIVLGLKLATVLAEFFKQFPWSA